MFYRNVFIVFNFIFLLSVFSGDGLGALEVEKNSLVDIGLSDEYNSSFKRHIESDVLLKRVIFHLNYAFDHSHHLDPKFHKLMAFIKYSLSSDIPNHNFFVVAGFKDRQKDIILDSLKQSVSGELISDFYKFTINSLIATMQVHEIDFSFSVDYKKNILVFISLLPKDHFEKFVRGLLEDEALPRDDKLLLYYNYLVSFITLTMIYNDQMDKTFDANASPVLMDVSRYHSKVGKMKCNMSNAGKLIDKNIGRDNFFFGLHAASTFVAVTATNKLYSMASGKDFDFKASAIQSIVPIAVMTAFYVIKKSVFSEKSKK